jgi:hypothetical protein
MARLGERRDAMIKVAGSAAWSVLLAVVTSPGCLALAAAPAAATADGECIERTAVVSFQAQSPWERHFVVGGEIDLCADGSFVVRVEPGWAGRASVAPRRAADVVVEHVAALVTMDAPTRQSVWDQAWCHASAPLPLQLTVAALERWDLESWRGPMTDPAEAIETLCGWDHGGDPSPTTSANDGAPVGPQPGALHR